MFSMRHNKTLKRGGGAGDITVTTTGRMEAGVILAYTMGSDQVSAWFGVTFH